MTTAHVVSVNGFQILQPNVTTDGDGFYISYNNYDQHEYGCDTTALVKEQHLNFYILNGDHRKAYASLIEKGFDACMEYFKNNLDMKNKYSENPPTKGD